MMLVASGTTSTAALLNSILPPLLDARALLRPARSVKDKGEHDLSTSAFSDPLVELEIFSWGEH